MPRFSPPEDSARRGSGATVPGGRKTTADRLRLRAALLTPWLVATVRGSAAAAMGMAVRYVSPAVRLPHGAPDGVPESAAATVGTAVRFPSQAGLSRQSAVPQTAARESAAAGMHTPQRSPFRAVPSWRKPGAATQRMWGQVLTDRTGSAHSTLPAVAFVSSTDGTISLRRTRPTASGASPSPGLSPTPKSG